VGNAGKSSVVITNFHLFNLKGLAKTIITAKMRGW
jgi:hypothetical protein